jgi:hypothetical protein
MFNCSQSNFFVGAFSERPFPISQPQMIPTFTRVVKRPHHIYMHKESDDILDSLRTSAFERGAIAKKRTRYAHPGANPS